MTAFPSSNCCLSWIPIVHVSKYSHACHTTWMKLAASFYFNLFLMFWCTYIYGVGRELGEVERFKHKGRSPNQLSWVGILSTCLSCKQWASYLNIVSSSVKWVTLLSVIGCLYSPKSNAGDRMSNKGAPQPQLAPDSLCGFGVPAVDGRQFGPITALLWPQPSATIKCMFALTIMPKMDEFWNLLGIIRPEKKEVY